MSDRLPKEDLPGLHLTTAITDAMWTTRTSPGTRYFGAAFPSAALCLRNGRCGAIAVIDARLRRMNRCGRCLGWRMRHACSGDTWTEDSGCSRSETISPGTTHRTAWAGHRVSRFDANDVTKGSPGRAALLFIILFWINFLPLAGYGVWWSQGGSNSRPLECHSSGLTTIVVNLIWQTTVKHQFATKFKLS